jgi:hypothetical protein
MTIDEKDWRKLCSMVVEETDPQRLSALLDQLIRSLQAHRQELNEGRQQSNPTFDPGR